MLVTGCIRDKNSSLKVFLIPIVQADVWVRNIWFEASSCLFVYFSFQQQINNHFPIPMDVLCKKDEQFSRITTVQPDSVYSVPLILAHKAALYLRPAGFGFVLNII